MRLATAVQMPTGPTCHAYTAAKAPAPCYKRCWRKAGWWFNEVEWALLLRHPRSFDVKHAVIHRSECFDDGVPHLTGADPLRAFAENVGGAQTLRQYFFDGSFNPLCRGFLVQ